jgi:RNA polymerase sigma-70 factor (ECF subfamily)
MARCHPGHTLESAALANEAYLKLVRAGGVQCENRVHFLALCSQIVRRILVDHARTRGSAKRGGSAVRISLDEAVTAAKARQVDILALDQALASLSEFDPRKGRVVELRYFGGLSVEEAAEVVGISPETAKRDWKMAKAWLFAELTGKRNHQFVAGRDASRGKKQQTQVEARENPTRISSGRIVGNQEVTIGPSTFRDCPSTAIEEHPDLPSFIESWLFLTGRFGIHHLFLKPTPEFWLHGE